MSQFQKIKSTLPIDHKSFILQAFQVISTAVTSVTNAYNDMFYEFQQEKIRSYIASADILKVEEAISKQHQLGLSAKNDQERRIYLERIEEGMKYWQERIEQNIRKLQEASTA
jgi:vacuolar-type H+-ATPase subunit E/Vma4